MSPVRVQLSWRQAFLSVLLLCGEAIAIPVSPAARIAPLAQDGQPQVVLGNAAAPAPAAARRKLHGKFLHITDFHPDEFYKVHSSTSEGAACHRGHGAAGTYGAETSDCDAPYALINATFDWMAANIRDDIDFVIWTGDSARHDSDERIPRSPAQVQGSNIMMAQKFIALFDDPNGKGMAVPVVPTLGNNDILPHNVLQPGPNKWLRQYTDIWGAFIPEEQRHSFEFGGWFYVEVIPNHLAVFSLNTLYFFDRNAGVDNCVSASEPGFKQLEWLRVQLQFMRERGVKVMLTGHIPPARTGSKQLWEETCWQKYTLWLRQYRDVVIASFYGHMNIDHFVFQDTKDINYALIGAVDEGDADEGDADEGDEDDADDADVADTPVAVRKTMADELDLLSVADYLQELRSGWSKLSRPTLTQSRTQGKKGKKGGKNKGKKLSHKWGERYQVSLVSPSIVPSYLPTLRIVEYNISGLENVPVWADGVKNVPTLPEDASLLYTAAAKGKKGTKPDPNLKVPEGPAKTAPYGPAYSVQPLTLLGYTQYYANLTYINNVHRTAEAVDASKWREGKNKDRAPALKKPKPHKFRFVVEYSTFKDKIYKLSDLTVNSFIDLAYRMGQDANKAAPVAGEDIEDEDSQSEDDDSDSEGDEHSGMDAAGKKKRKKKKKEKKEKNKVWLHFLRHAFVTTVDKKELKNI